MMNTKNQHIANKLLVEEFQNGREDALKLLIKQFHPKMVRVISYHTQSHEPVEDLAQECWLSIIQKLGEVNLKISFDAWAITIARRKAIDWVRRQQRMRRQDREIQAELKTKTEGIENNEDRLINVQIAICQLPPTQQIVLNMFYRDNLNLQEISDVLDVAEGTVKSRLFYAREKLKNIINP